MIDALPPDRSRPSSAPAPRTLLAALAAALVLLAAAPAEAKAKKAAKKAAEPELPTLLVETWLALAPAPEPRPLFADEKPGGWGIAESLGADPGVRTLPAPAAGETAGWFAGGRAAWTETKARDGSVTLAAPAASSASAPGDAGSGPAGAAKKGAGAAGAASRDDSRPAPPPAVAWLAARVRTDRFRALDLELDGTHPRRIWIDGEPVASGGLSKDEATVKGKVKLVPGSHSILVKTVFDPARGGDWKVAARLRGTKEAGPLEGLSVELDPRRDVDLLDVLDPPRITSVAISPDGELVATGLSRIVPGTDDSETWLELRAASDGSLRRTWRGAFGMGQVAWAPTGRRLTYVTQEKGSGSGDPPSTLWIADLDAGTAEPILERVEGLAGCLWAPDGSGLACQATVKPEPDKRGLKRHEALLDREAGYRTKSHVQFVGWPGRERRPISAGALASFAAAFSPDARRLLVTRRVEDLSERPYSRDEIWEIDLATLEGRKLRDVRWLRSAGYAPDGRRLLIHAGPGAFGEAGWSLPQGMIPNENDGRLYIWDPVPDAVDPITKDFAPSPVAAEWSRRDGRIYLRATDRDTRALFRYDPPTRRFERLGSGFEVADECAFAERAPVAACTGTSAWTPQALSAVDLGTGSPRILHRPAGAWFANVRQGGLERFDFRASSGRTIEGRLYTPPGFDPSRRASYPAIVFYYGGTSPVERDFGGRYPKEWWAALGYVVYVLQPSGATGFGLEHSAFHVNDWGEVTSREILEGTRAFLDAWPAVDPKRVGCIGASYGGFMTMSLLTKSDLFAAAVSHAGISSLSSYWGEGYWGYSYSASATAGSFPWNRPDIYVERSPLFHAEKVKTPLLLTHGVADTNVPRGESLTFFTALRLLGAPVELVEVEGQDHWILDHAKRIVWSRTIAAWFDRWLKGRPEWWEDLYPAPK